MFVSSKIDRSQIISKAKSNNEVTNQDLDQLRRKYIHVLERYQRLLKLLEMEQENTQKFIGLFKEGQKRNCELEHKLESLNKIKPSSR